MRVQLTDHAITQAHRRSGVGQTTITREVKDALKHGRRAVRKPAWLNQVRTKAGGGRHRYVWPETEDRVYVIVETSDGWVVLTCLTPM